MRINELSHTLESVVWCEERTFGLDVSDYNPEQRLHVSFIRNDLLAFSK